MGLSIWCNCYGSCRDGSAGKRNIRGDDNASRSRVLRNPVVGNIQPARNNDSLDKCIVPWNGNVAVGDDHHPDPMSLSDPVDFRLNRTSISVDKDNNRAVRGMIFFFHGISVASTHRRIRFSLATVSSCRTESVTQI